MAIDRLAPAQGLMAALRAEVSQRKDRTHGKAAPSGTSETYAPRRDMAVLRKQMVEIAKSVDVRNADAVRKARPLMVKTILLWEFGSGLREHPEWQAMMESIMGTLDAQGAAGEAEFVKLIESLRR